MIPDDAVTRIQTEWARERPEVDTAPQAIIGRLHRLGAHLSREITKVYDDFGLSEGEFDVLAALRRAGSPFERGASEIADHTMVTSGAITKRVDRLVAAGLVERRTDTADGRGRRVRLTPQGLALIDEAFTAHMANEQRLIDALSQRQRDELTALLAQWLSNFE